MGNHCKGTLEGQMNVKGVFFVRVLLGEYGRTAEEAEDNIDQVLEDVLPVNIDVVSVSGIEIDRFSRVSEDDEDEEDEYGSFTANFDAYITAELEGFEFSHADVTGSADVLWEEKISCMEDGLANSLLDTCWRKPPAEKIADANLVQGFSHGIRLERIEHISGVAEFEGEDETGAKVEMDIHFSQGRA